MGIFRQKGTKIWKIFCESENIYEFLTKEFIERFGSYLEYRIKKEIKEKINILEVGAGDGRLSHLLNEEIEKHDLKNKASVMPVDSGEWRKIKPKFRVEKLSTEEALTKYKPQIVISSWMPEGRDWTKNFRIQENVRQYILIGDPLYCGARWDSWGWWHHRDPEVSNRKGEIPPCEKDGFFAEEIYSIAQKQLGRTDEFVDNNHIRNTRIVSFRKSD